MGRPTSQVKDRIFRRAIADRFGDLLRMDRRFAAPAHSELIEALARLEVVTACRDIKAYLAQRNAAPKPYTWKAEGAEILAKIKRARAALDQAKAIM